MSRQHRPRWWWAPAPLGVELDGEAELGHRLVELALVLPAQAEELVGRCPFEGEFGGAAEFGHRLIEPALVPPAHAELEVGRSHLRGEFDSLAGGPDRLVHLTVVLQSHADAEVDLGRRWPQRQGGPVEADRLCRLPLPQRFAEGVVEPEVLRVPRLRRPQQRLGLLVFLSQLLRQQRDQRGRRPALGAPSSSRCCASAARRRCRSRFPHSAGAEAVSPTADPDRPAGPGPSSRALNRVSPSASAR